VIGIKPKRRLDAKQNDYQKWWESLSDEEQSKIIEATRNPAGEKNGGE
jgi:hypothetical protein